MQVRGEVHAGGEESLALLALALAVELLPPLAHKAERRVIAGQQLHRAARLIQGIAGGGVAPGGTVQTAPGTSPHHLCCAGHQCLNVHAGHGDGQQTHGGQHAVSAADLIRYHKGLPALGVRQGFQRAPGLVGGGIDPPARGLFAVLLLQSLPEKPERHRRLRGSTRLGDHIHGEVHVRDQVQRFLQCVGGEAISNEIDVRGGFFLQIIVGGAQAVDDAPGPQVGPADAHHHQGLGVALNPLRGGENPGELLPVVALRQMDPASELSASAAACLQLLLGFLEPEGQFLLIGCVQKFLHFKQPDVQHHFPPSAAKPPVNSLPGLLFLPAGRTATKSCVTMAARIPL